MTELLEPAPMFDDGEDYGGPIGKKNSDDTELELDRDINDINSNADSDIDLDINVSSDQAVIHKPHSHSLHESGNALLVSSIASDAQLQQARGSTVHKATSGVRIGENEEEEVNGARSDSDSSRHVWENDAKDARQINRIGSKGCCGDCCARCYSWPRLRIFLSFLYLSISMILMCGDIFGALFIANEIWNFRYKYANTEFHELWFAILMVLISAPFLILWAAHLIFIEEQISIKSTKCKCIKYGLMLLYLFTPIGILALIVYEFVYIYLYQMMLLLCYRFICGNPSYKMVMNKKKTKGSRAYLRFRKIIHLLSSSVPLMIYYFILWYFDPYPRLRWKFLAAAGFISSLNSLYTILSFVHDAISVNIPFTQYVVLSFRLFGGFIPKLRAIQNGEIRRINYSSFAFGNYTYAKFADVIESETSKLETIILTSSTLSELSVSLCYQLGSVCAAKKITIIILKNYTPFAVWFKYLFPTRKPYKVRMTQLKQAFRRCGLFNDVAEATFEELDLSLDALYGKHDIYYYYKDFVCDWNGYLHENYYNNNYPKEQQERHVRLGTFDGLLRILAPHIVDKNNQHTNKNAERQIDERLLNLVLGTGTINEIDPNNKTSALFYAIIQNDYDLVDRLTSFGATISSKDEWQQMGQYINQLVKDNNMDDLKLLIKVIKDKKEIECDLSYHDIDGRNAVMYAAMNGNLEICKLLLSCALGADILHMDQDGNTAADLAKQYSHTHVEQWLKSQFL